MDLNTPFLGTLYLPDKEFLASGSPVLLEDGRAVAAIRWHTWTERFEVLDPEGNLLAECRPGGVFRRRYPVIARDGRVVIELVPGGWSTYNGADLTLASGRSLAIRRQSMWSERRFEFHASEGLAGRILPTTGTFSFRPDSYAFEVLLPVMSALEAISLAQALRLVVQGRRRQAARRRAPMGGTT
jgi:hypothetical protein